MWDWYNRPGGRAALPTKVVAAIMIVAGLAVGVLIMLIYLLVWPFLFTRVPG